MARLSLLPLPLSTRHISPTVTVQGWRRDKAHISPLLLSHLTCESTVTTEHSLRTMSMYAMCRSHKCIRYVVHVPLTEADSHIFGIVCPRLSQFASGGTNVCTCQTTS
ncbi:hypothetical protein GBAR_LOCUS21164, partial [Geodia barretti]